MVESDRRGIEQNLRAAERREARAFGIPLVPADQRSDPRIARVETAEEICDTILEAAGVIPAGQLGTTDDCGFSPFADDLSTSRDAAFAKIRSRIEGTKLAEQKLS
jgi:hypothetical protein